MLAKVTVIIAHRNDPHLMETVHQVMAQKPGFDFDVVVVDDNSSAYYRPDPEWMRGIGVRLIQLDLQGGCGRARNFAVSVTATPVIAFMDSDLDPSPNWLRDGYDAVKPDVMVTGPVPKRHRNKKPTLAERYNYIESPHAAGARTYGTGNVMVRREDFIKAGRFNENITRGHDMDFFSRWKGEVRVIPGMTASHPSKNHREKVQTIRELVKDWKKLGHRPSFVRRLAPDRNLLRNVMQADLPASEKASMVGYHMALKGVYLWYWLKD